MDSRLILGFILGLIGSFFGAMFSHYFSERRRRKETFNRAAAAFRAAFVDEIFNIKKNVGPFFQRFEEWPEEIEIVNEKAKIIFEVFVPQCKRAGFNAAWEQYRDPEKKSEIKENPLDPEYYKKLGEIRLTHLNLLLEYAKPE